MKRQRFWKWRSKTAIVTLSPLVILVFGKFGILWYLTFYVTHLMKSDSHICNSVNIDIISSQILASNSLILSTNDLYEWGVGQNPWYYWLWQLPVKHWLWFVVWVKIKPACLYQFDLHKIFIPKIVADDDNDDDTDDETHGCAVWWMIKNGAKTAWGCLSVRLLQPVCSDFIRQIQIQIQI